jgi:hypothetical protein
MVSGRPNLPPHLLASEQLGVIAKLLTKKAATLDQALQVPRLCGKRQSTTTREVTLNSLIGD